MLFSISQHPSNASHLLCLILQRLEPSAYIIATRIGRNDTGGTSDILRLGESIWRIPGGHTQGQLQAHLLGGQEPCGAGKLKPDFSIYARW